MSDHKAFARFPAAGGGGAYQFVDVFAIEAIGQSPEPTMATIFVTGSERYYQVEITKAELARSGESDAAGWILSLALKVAQIELGIPFQESDDDSDDEDDFTPPPGFVEVPRPE